MFVHCNLDSLGMSVFFTLFLRNIYLSEVQTNEEKCDHMILGLFMCFALNFILYEHSKNVLHFLYAMLPNKNLQ